ncbi:MAG: DNA alkylation repair protein [Chloroflexi bacterium]|nr:DNA alkylation repair protein [Chloroflexota bacterium]
MRYEDVIKKLRQMADPEVISGMARFGITAKEVMGVKIPDLRKLAKEIGRDHELALKLWGKEIRETRIIAAMIDDPALVTEKQIESWVRDFDSWEACDQCCSNLFEKTPFAYDKCFQWSQREEEFVKRAGFVLMARLAVSDKKAGDEKFESFFPIILRGAADERNFVRKAVNWALRQIGKRNLALNEKAVRIGEKMREMDSSSARWIASDALRELKSQAVLDRLKMKARSRPAKKTAN